MLVRIKVLGFRLECRFGFRGFGFRVECRF